MRRALRLPLVILLALAEAAMLRPSVARPANTITFSGRVVDGAMPFAPGVIVTIQGEVIARSHACIEARVEVPRVPRQPRLLLCPPSGRWPGELPRVGEPVAARARITGIRATPDGATPCSQSFVLMRVN